MKPEKQIKELEKGCDKQIGKKDWKILKKWIIENIENDLGSWTFPVITKATEENIKEAIKQNKHHEKEKDSAGYEELQNLKEDLEIFRIVKKQE